jgi:hypothetical protein
MLEENVGEAGAEVGPVNVYTPEFGQIDLLASRTENLKS